ncbi:hypothetical protein ATCC90586_004960 [Pythium insidiosum]|nr:hypothetical protein ATCC90586_004960 [Pythium insidiosum]
MTPLEAETLHLWIERKIHLATPPFFLQETHTGPERDAFADYHRDHLGFRLYVVLPIGVALSEVNAKYDFCFTALLSAPTQTDHDRLLQLYRDAQTTLCEPRSRIATLRFVTPELRDSWNGYSFLFGKDRVTLTATDSLTSDTPRAGFDAGAQQLLYHVFLRGNHRLSHHDVRAIGSAAARKPVLDVALIESFAASDYSPPKWKLTFDQIACPPAIERMRRLEVTYGESELSFLVIHPRATRRSPCTRCLSVRHAPKDCDTKDPAKYVARHSLSVKIERAQPLPKITATPPRGDLADLLSALRQQAAPEVAERLAAERREQQAAAERKAKRATQVLQRQAQSQQARRRLAQQARATVAKQLQALRLEYRNESSPTAPAHGPAGAATPSPAPGHETRPDAQCADGTTAAEPDTEDDRHRAPTTTDATSEDMDVDDSPSSASPKSQSGALPASPEQAPSPAEQDAVSPELPSSPKNPDNRDRTAPASAGLAPTTPPHRSAAADATLTAPSDSMPLNPANQIPPRTAAPTSTEITSVPSAPAPTHQALVVLEPKHLATVSAPGKRRTGPICTSSDEEADLRHVPKWWRVTTRADAGYDTARTLIPVISSPLFPNSWSPIAAATPLAIEGPELPTSADSTSDGQAPAEKPSRPLKQLALSEFYAPRTLAEAQALLESELLTRHSQQQPDWQTVFPSPQLDSRLAVLRSPDSLPAWAHALDARVVNTPGTGGCFYFALHGARTRRLTGATMSICNFHVREGKFYKNGVCSAMDTYLVPMLDAGTLTVADFQRRFKDRLPSDRDAALPLIRAYFDTVRATPITKMGVHQWGGDEEIYAAVWFVREPIFVIGVDQAQRTHVRAIWLDRPSPTGPEEIHHHLPAPGEAFELLRVFLNNRVTPMVLVHSSSHFNCLRFNERLYTEWTADDVSGAKMRDRLDQALAQLGWYVAPTVADDVPTSASQPPQPGSGSLYTPSDSSGGEPSIPTTDEPLSPISHYALLSALNPRRRRRGPLALLWAQAERLNLAAYVSWNSVQAVPAPPSPDLESACRGWSAQPDALLALLRALPYPEVAVSLLSPDVVQRLGNELSALAATRGLPDFVLADDPADACHLWAKLVVLVVVAVDPDVHPSSCIQWLHDNPQASTLALHAIRLYDWTDRELFFQTLLQAPRPAGMMAVGGDFNCVLEPELDRSRPTTKDQLSASLSALLSAWDLVDSVSDDQLQVQSRLDVAAFQERYHTFYYSTADDTLASARLDRWYVSRTTYAQPRQRLPQLRYPLPAVAADAVVNRGRAILEAASPQLTSSPGPTSAALWDALKACGTDGLGNDWYHDLRDELSPLLAELFTSWLTSSCLPPSFLTATVFCLPKTGSPRTGLDYRPIALLNTDYKIYARILLQRLQARLAHLVSPTQYGFVPGRQVHDALDIWSALQARSSTPGFPRSAMAVLLDFSKAYDSLDRHFLSLALRRHGFAPELVNAVESLHLGTTASFVVDGDLSGVEEVACGIRQGCPLAPTLFILAADVLYDMLNLDGRLQGLPLSASVSVTAVGYADDTTVYLNSPSEAEALADCLSTFASVSGLCVNTAKSTAVFLRCQDPQSPPLSLPFPVAAPSQHVRYLGRQIASAPVADQIWQTTLQQLRARLHLAEIKTTNALQRIQVASSVILPKLLYTARHDWPSATLLRLLQRFLHEYVWFGSLAAQRTGRRAWIGADVAAASRHDGGLQIPNLRDEFLLLSARTVTGWLSSSDSTRSAVRECLLSTRGYHLAGGGAPGRGSAPRLSLRSSIGSSGLTVLSAAASIPRTATEHALLVEALPVAGRAPLSSGKWVDGWYERDFSRLREQLVAIRRTQHEAHGRVNVPALLATPVLAPDLLLHHSGRALTATDLGHLSGLAAPLGDLLEIRRLSPMVLKFRLKGIAYPYVAVNGFRLLCDTLVICYPDLLGADLDPTRVAPLGKTPDSWYLQPAASGPRLVRVTERGVRTDLGTVRSHRHAEQLARTASGRPRLRLTPHPLTCPVLPLWGTLACFSKKRLRLCVASPRRERALASLDARSTALRSAAPTLSDALDAVPWSAVHVLPHSSSRQRLAFYRVKCGALSGWSHKHARRGCPRCPELGAAGGATPHIVWECPQAQTLWLQLFSRWRSLGLWPSDCLRPPPDFVAALFSLRLPRTPPRVWYMDPLSQLPQGKAAPDDPYPVIAAVWQQLVLETIVAILAWRRASDASDDPWSDHRARATHAAMCHQVLLTLSHRLSAGSPTVTIASQLVDSVREFFAAPPPPAPDPAAPATPSRPLRTILFFDGGSRGNPGAGGSGSCIVRYDTTDATSTVAWSAAMSLAAPTTTNNQAEYHGLITGLRAALARGWHAPDVIGDSALILRQMRQHRPPKNARLKSLYLEARRLADELNVSNWLHHVRSHNKVADALANLAMDTATSSQVVHPTCRPGHLAAAAHLPGDLAPWLAHPSGGLVEIS